MVVFRSKYASPCKWWYAGRQGREWMQTVGHYWLRDPAAHVYSFTIAQISKWGDEKSRKWWQQDKCMLRDVLGLFAPFPSSADTICINWLFQYIYDIIHRTCRRTEKWENWVMIWVTRKSCCKKGVLTNGRDLIYVCTLNISKRSSALSEVI